MPGAGRKTFDENVGRMPALIFQAGGMPSGASVGTSGVSALSSAGSSGLPSALRLSFSSFLRFLASSFWRFS